jgi:hypothetical protein
LLAFHPLIQLSLSIEVYHKGAALVKKTIDPVTNAPLTTISLFSKSVSVLLTNGIPLYGVFHNGWNSFVLILLFIAEGVIVFLTDVIKKPFIKSKEQNKVLFFEFVFIFFFGFFAILIFGRDEDSTDLLMTMRTSFGAAQSLPLWSVAGILVMRLVRTAQELMEAGVFGTGSRQKLYFNGGGWMFLLFFLCMTAPFIADKSPNPMAGLIAVIVLKSFGELFALWAQRIEKAIK